MKSLLRILLLASLPIYAQTGTIDPAFNVIDNGSYTHYIGGDSPALNEVAVWKTPMCLLSDGKVIVKYGYYGAFGIKRLNADGSIDVNYSFQDVENDIIEIFATIDDKILVVFEGGLLKRYNVDGSLDTSFTEVQVDGISDLDTGTDGKIIIVGGFTTVNGEAHKYLARLNSDGSLDTTMPDSASGFSAQISCVEILIDGKVMLGGYFTNYNNGIWSYYIARLNVNGTLDNSFTFPSNKHFYNYIFDIKQAPDGKIYVAGTEDFFYNSGQIDVTRRGIVRLNANGSVDDTFITTSAMSNMSDGEVSGLTPMPDGKVVFMRPYGNGDGNVSKFICLNQDGSLDTTFVGVDSPTSQCTTFLHDNKILANISFKSPEGITRSGLHRLNANGSLDYSFNPCTGANFSIKNVFPVSDNNLVIIGSFTSYNDAPAAHMARINEDGTLDTTFVIDPSINIYSELDRNYIVHQQSDGKIVVAGKLFAVNGTFQKIIRLNTDGSIDTSFIPDTAMLDSNSVEYGEVTDFVIQADGKIVLIGNDIPFFISNGSYRPRRLNADGSLDATFTNKLFNDKIKCVYQQPNGTLFFGGEFSLAGTQSAYRLAKTDENLNLDTAFMLNLTNVESVNSILALPQDQFMVNYTHTIFDGMIARINNNGTKDTSFTAPSAESDDSIIHNFKQLLLTSSGQVVAINEGNTYNSTSFNSSLVFINTDGSLDTSVQLPLQEYNTVNTIAPLGCNKIIVAGAFISLNNVPKNNMVSIYSIPTPPAPIVPEDQTLNPGQTIGDIYVDGSNIIWYDGELSNDCTMPFAYQTNSIPNVLDPATALVDGSTYYVTQTVEGYESDTTAYTVHFDQLSTETLTLQEAVIYPNPVSSVVNIQSSFIINKVEVFSPLGQRFVSQNFNANKATLDISSLIPGIYMVFVESSNGITSTKIMKQ